VAHEIEPWDEGGERWRRLAVTFPTSNGNHNPDQIFYFDASFIERRMDYSPDTSDPPIAHYTYYPKTFDRLVFPTRRRVVLHDGDGIADQRCVAITFDIDTICLESWR
jgi:hypothetical protein